MKKLIAFGVLYLTSVSVLAGFIEADWLNEGDGNVTLVEELNIEILDVSYSRGSHTDISNRLLTDERYDGFRYMNSLEMEQIMGLLTDNMQSSYYEPSEDEKEGINNFLSLIDSPGGSWSFMTCEHAYGCTPYPVDFFLHDSCRHTITPYLLFWCNDNEDFEKQMLVRKAPAKKASVPEPAALFLLLSGLGMLLPRAVRRFTA